MAEGLRLDIQGLRAIAVLSVVLFHADETLLTGGFVGVDIFFVISGYLITGILMRELEQGRFSLLGFYERRVKRLFPALYTMLAVVFVFGWLTLPPDAFGELGRTAVSAVFFVSNVDFFFLSDYFGAGAKFQPLLHTWSLGVEEQFYIAFPLVLLTLHHLARKHLRLMLVLCAVASLALCVWVLERRADAAFFLAPFRAYELLIGAAIAGLTPKLTQRMRDGLSLLGLVLIAGSVVLFEPRMDFPGFAALAPCIGTALVLYAGAGGESLGGKLISGRFFGFYGGLSYSLYLWHWPVLVFGRHFLFGEPTLVQLLALLGLTVALAVLSWRFIEQPALRLRTPQWRTLTAGGGAMIAGALIGGVIFLSDGAPQRFTPQATALFASDASHNPRRGACHNNGEAVRPYAQSCAFGAEAAAPRYAVWGDSHGTELVVALGERLAPQGEAARQLSSSACPPALDYDGNNRPHCIAQNADTLAGLTHDARIDTVLLTASFEAYPADEHAALFDGYRRAATALHAAGKRVVIVYPVPIYEYDVPDQLGLTAHRGADPRTAGLKRSAVLAHNRDAIAFLDTLREELSAEALHPIDALCDRAHDICRPYQPDRGGVLYFNRDHLSLEGARLVAARLDLGEAVRVAALRSPDNAQR